MPDETRTTDPVVDELRGKTADEVLEIIDVTRAKITELHMTPEGELRSLTEAEDKALAHLLKLNERAKTVYEEHRKISDVLRDRPKVIEYSRLGGTVDDPYADVRRMPTREARDRALRVLDSRENSGHMSAAEKDEVEKQIRTSTDIARRVLVTETEEYRDAWLKLVTKPHPFLNQEEIRAMQAWEEYRVMSENVTTAGGFGIPVKSAA